MLDCKSHYWYPLEIPDQYDFPGLGVVEAFNILPYKSPYMYGKHVDLINMINVHARCLYVIIFISTNILSQRVKRVVVPQTIWYLLRSGWLFMCQNINLVHGPNIVKNVCRTVIELLQCNLQISSEFTVTTVISPSHPASPIRLL